MKKQKLFHHREHRGKREEGESLFIGLTGLADFLVIIVGFQSMATKTEAKYYALTDSILSLFFQKFSVVHFFFFYA
jgi:hypothetical protein